MTETYVQIEQKDDVGVIRLSDPATLNALTVPMVVQLVEALDDLSGTSRTIVVTSDGRAFCSGANLAGGIEVVEEPSGPDLGVLLETHINPLMMRLRELPVPWIASVRGAAAGVGCSLALAADLIVASDDPTAAYPVISGVSFR
jgi:2-(1,2-epoxy-1,2-dihydrophenyl)acetyl-CoA isomerase